MEEIDEIYVKRRDLPVWGKQKKVPFPYAPEDVKAQNHHHHHSDYDKQLLKRFLNLPVEEPKKPDEEDEEDDITEFTEDIELEQEPERNRTEPLEQSDKYGKTRPRSKPDGSDMGKALSRYDPYGRSQGEPQPPTMSELDFYLKELQSEEKKQNCIKLPVINKRIEWKTFTFSVTCVFVLLMCILGFSAYMGVKELQLRKLQTALFKAVYKPEDDANKAKWLPPKRPKPELKSTAPPTTKAYEWLEPGEISKKKEKKGGVHAFGDFTEIVLRVKNWRFNPALADRTSRGFTGLSVNFCKKINTIYKGAGIGDLVEDCWVILFSEGSIVVTFGIQFTEQIHFSQLMTPLRESALKEGGILYDLKVSPKEITVLSLFDSVDTTTTSTTTSTTTTSTASTPTEDGDAEEDESEKDEDIDPNKDRIPAKVEEKEEEEKKKEKTTSSPDRYVPKMGKGVREGALKDASVSSELKDPAPSIDEYFCYDLSDGIYADPSDCSSFVLCANQKTSLMSCGKGSLFFNVKSGSCDSPVCKPESDMYTSIYKECMKTLDTLIPYKGDCDLFIHCFNRKAILLGCPEGQKWDHTDKKCKWAAFAFCGKDGEQKLDPGSCKGRDDGFYPHQEDCKQYFQCAASKRYNWTCEDAEDGGDMVFDPRTGNCNLRKKVEPCYEDKDKPSFCETQKDGFYEHRKCVKMIRCYKNERFDVDCPEKLVYNPLIKKCDTMENYECIGDSPGRHLNPCAGQKDGYYEHHAKCDKFIRCRSGVASTLTCVFPFIFDPNKKRCGSKDDYDCPNDPNAFNADAYCNGLPNGLYKHPLDCNKFVRCNRESTNRALFCPSHEFHFNADIARCVAKDSFECNLDEEEDQNPVQKFCEDKGNGLYVHPESCHRIIRCTHGNANVMFCPTHKLVYDPSRRRCVPKSTYNCTIDSTKDSTEEEYTLARG